MKAITAKFHGPTNTKGSRYSAFDSDGNRVTLQTDYELSSEQNHDRAALALCRKLGWKGELCSGGIRNGNVYVFTGAHRDRLAFVRDGLGLPEEPSK